MSTTKHTPGPWIFAEYNPKQFGLGQRGEGAFFFLQCIYNKADDPQARANARLIAAAPSLYEYVSIKANCGDKEAIELLEMIEMGTPKGTKPWNAGTSQGWTDIRAAIAKATGV